MSEAVAGQPVIEHDQLVVGDQSSPTSEKADSGDGATRGGKRRRARLFPATSFDEAMFLANAIQAHGAGQEIRRLTLFSALERSPDSGPTRRLITASGQYGLTTGSYSAEVLNLTEKGRIASDPSSPADAQLRARIELAVESVPPFASIFEKYKGSRLPSVEVLRDAAIEAGVEATQAPECVEIFLANARGLGLIRTIGGSEHLVTIEDALDQVAGVEAKSLSPVSDQRDIGAPVASDASSSAVVPQARSTSAKADLNDICFIISPIGSDGSEQRLHADLVLSSLIEPALQELGLTPVRADKISKPGMITGQVIDHLTRAKMVIADLSFGNPNVYYELALRHATRKPVVQLIRSSDPLPFDVGQFRTVVVDMTSIYTLVPQLDLHRQEIARQCRAAIEEGVAAESPLSRFYPSFWVHVPGEGKAR